MYSCVHCNRRNGVTCMSLWRLVSVKAPGYPLIMGLLPDKHNCGLRMRRECRNPFPCHRRLANTCVTHVPWCMSGSLTSDFLLIRWLGKCSQHSRRLRNPQFCASGKRPIARAFTRKPRLCFKTDFFIISESECCISNHQKNLSSCPSNTTVSANAK